MRTERKHAMKKLTLANLRTRRRFLKSLAKKGAVPAVVIYSIHKNAPPVFAREPI